MILYIHGFNSGKGAKSQKLEALFDEVICPELTNNPKKDLEMLKSIVRENNITHVVGTSLGGFYGMILATEFPYLQFHLINPSFEPWWTLNKFVNQEITNYATGKKETLMPYFVTELREIRPDIFKKQIIDRITFYVGTEDEVLNHSIWENEIIKNGFAVKIHKTKQDHRHADISQVLANVKEYVANFL